MQPSQLFQTDLLLKPREFIAHCCTFGKRHLEQPADRKFDEDRQSVLSGSIVAVALVVVCQKCMENRFMRCICSIARHC